MTFRYGATSKVRTRPAIPCKYCLNQGLPHVHARMLTGQDAETKQPGTVRYGCVNGHKFAVREEDVRV